MDDVNKIITKINQGNLSTMEILNYLNSPFVLVKANAILQLVRIKASNNDVLEKLVSVASAQENESRIWGTITIAKLAIAALKWINTPDSLIKFDELKETLMSEEQEDLDWLLKNGPTFETISQKERV